MKTKTSFARDLMNRSACDCGSLAVLLSAFALAWFAFSPGTQAACQNGCLTNFNTALGEGVLANDTTGSDNTGIGYDGLLGNTTGIANTASGASALVGNTTGSYNTATGLGALENNNGSSNTATGALCTF